MWITLMAVFMLYGVFMTASSMHWQAKAKAFEIDYKNKRDDYNLMSDTMKIQKQKCANSEERVRKIVEDTETRIKTLINSTDKLIKKNRLLQSHKETLADDNEYLREEIAKLEKPAKRKVGRPKKVKK